MSIYFYTSWTSLGSESVFVFRFQTPELSSGRNWYIYLYLVFHCCLIPHTSSWHHRNIYALNITYCPFQTVGNPIDTCMSVEYIMVSLSWNLINSHFVSCDYFLRCYFCYRSSKFLVNFLSMTIFTYIHVHWK